MTDAAAPQTARTNAPDDWARSLLDRQLQMLSQLAEAGMEIIQAIKGQATGAPEPAAAPIQGDLCLAFNRVARAVRMTLLLQAQLIEDIKTPKGPAKAARSGPREERKAQVLGIVEAIARAEHQDPETVERLIGEGAERLERDDACGEMLKRPVSELVERICLALGLHPDWPSLAEEDWAQAEIHSGKLGPALQPFWADYVKLCWRSPTGEPIPLRRPALSG